MNDLKKSSLDKKTKTLTVLTILVAGWLISASVGAQNDMCIPQRDSVTGSPKIDGIINETINGVVVTDPGWGNATQFNLNAINGAPREGQLYATWDTSFVYFGFVIEEPKPTTGSFDTTILLALSTTSKASEDWRIHIHPFDTNLVSGPNHKPKLVTFWRNSDTWNDGVGGTTPASGWLREFKFSRNGSQWAIEIKIPRSRPDTNDGIFFPPSDPFKLYVDVLSTSNFLNTVTQAPWPTGREIISLPTDSKFLNELTPPKNDWGTASLAPRPACTGLFLAIGDVGTDNNPSSKIKRYTPGTSDPFPTDCSSLPEIGGNDGPNNEFFANVHNDTGATAPDVFATFKLKNWGLPNPFSAWQPIGPPPNPNGTTNPSQSVPTTGRRFTFDWPLSYKQSCFAAQSPHKCLLVEIDSDDASVRFKNRGVRRNMDFVQASVFSRPAEIEGRGYGEPGNGRSQHEFLITVDTKVMKPRPDTSQAPVAKISGLAVDRPIPETHRMTWIARGYRKTGNFLIINGREYEHAESVGGFGYIAEHRGPVSKWRHQLTGNGLENLGQDTYQISVPPDGSVQVTTRIEAVEPGAWSFSLHGGFNDPQGDAGRVLDGGVSAGLDLEYLLNNTWALELFAGFDQFRSASDFPDVDVLHLSLNAKYYRDINQLTRWFGQVGVGLYEFDPGDSEEGFNVGSGVQYNVRPNLAIEGTVKYHSVSSGDFEFLTTHGGLRFRF